VKHVQVLTNCALRSTKLLTKSKPSIMSYFGVAQCLVWCEKWTFSSGA